MTLNFPLKIIWDKPLSVLLCILLGVPGLTPAWSQTEPERLKSDSFPRRLSQQRFERMKAALRPYPHQCYVQEITLGPDSRVHAGEIVPVLPAVEAEVKNGSNNLTTTSLRLMNPLEEAGRPENPLNGTALLPLLLSVTHPILIPEGKRGVVISLIIVNPAALDPDPGKAGQVAVKTRLISDLGDPDNFVSDAYEGEIPWIVNSAWQELRIFISAEAVAKLKEKGVEVGYIFQLGYDLMVVAPQPEVKRFYTRATSPIVFVPTSLSSPTR